MPSTKTQSARRLTPGRLDLTPHEVAAQMRHLPGFVFFDTALDSSGSSSHSFGTGGFQGTGGMRPAFSILAASPTQVITGRTPADWETLRRAVAERQLTDVPDSAIPLGFAAGWVEYDGSFCFGFYDQLLAFQHGWDGGWFSVGGAELPKIEPGANSHPSHSSQHSHNAPLCFSPSLPKEQFLAMVRHAQEYIVAGDIYQVNLSHRFSADWAAYTFRSGKSDPGASAFALYSALRHYSPAPHAVLMTLEGRTVVSSSPELFLEMSGRAIRTRPIKGTRPRRADRHADERSAYDLITSPKEIAELVMITDLERNDLGRVCEYGSVVVSDLLNLERYEQVFHLVSTVEGRLRPEIDAVTAFRECFPGGSITGAPKKRASEIIAELEPVPRGLYTGALGYFGFNGESQFNIAIRTVVIEDGEAHFHAGAGIVAESDPEKEWQETLDKAAGILLAAERLGREK